MVPNLHGSGDGVSRMASVLFHEIFLQWGLLDMDDLIIQ